MKTVLSISSQVVRGHVGNSAAVFALQMQGYDVWPVPTIILSNHPGHGATAGERIRPERMADMISALEDHGWLEEVDAVLTGYIADAAQVPVIVDTITKLRARKPETLYCCDPVLGDHGKGLYVPLEVAEAIRHGLVPLADVVTPNLFELGYITNTESEFPDLKAVTTKARSLNADHVLVTSAQETAAGDIQNLFVTPGGAFVAHVRRLAGVPNGTGDLMAALMLACRLEDLADRTAIDTCTGAVGAVIGLSMDAGTNELELVASRNRLPVKSQQTE